ncbi:unnamed protein product [Camellia sinensis]
MQMKTLVVKVLAMTRRGQWLSKRLIKIVRHGVLSTLDEQILESTNGDESTTQIRSELEAKVAGSKIFQNVARRASKFIYLEDLQGFMLEDEALKTMSHLGGSSESEKISKTSLKNWVVIGVRLMMFKIISYIESKKDHWYPSPTMVPMNLEELNKLKKSVWLRHRMNHQDIQGRWFRRALVVEEMIKIFKELDIEYILLPLDVNIRNMPPISSTHCPNHHDHCEVEHD